MEKQLKPTQIVDEEVLNQCKRALNKWSNNQPFCITRNLGDAVELVSAQMFHAYSFSLNTKYLQRKFELKQGGSPVSSPVDVEDLDMWEISEGDKGNFDKALKETCHKVECEHCHGEGKHTCDECNGDKRVTCDKCDGKGKVACSTCGGKGQTYCSKCRGGGKIGMFVVSTAGGLNHVRCPYCNDKQVETCRQCHGSKEESCKKCGGKGEIVCSKCGGKGIIKCGQCDGRGWNPFTWHLIQSENSDALDEMFYDAGFPEKTERKKCKKYQAQTLLAQKKDAEQIEISIDEDCSDFAKELTEKWEATYEKFEEADDIHVMEQSVELIQYDALVRYEYKYKDQTYSIWIDLANKRVFEGAEGGLMSEWSANIAKDGDKYAGKNPQMAIYNYAKACAISENNQEPAKKIRRQLSLGSWLFRLAAGGVGGWLWSLFLESQNVNPLMGWYIVGALVFADIFFARKSLFWGIVLGGTALCGIVAYLFPDVVPQEWMAKIGEWKWASPFPDHITSDPIIREYIICSMLLFVATTLLFARDLALRLRGGVLVFPILGALAGAACAPAAYFDFAPDQMRALQIVEYATYGICGLAILRIFSRAFVQNCGRNARKFPNALIRLEANTLKPVFWTMPFYALFFGAIGAAWYMYAGPGVGVAAKAQAAQRLIMNDKTLAKGKYYLELTAKEGYAPSMVCLAEASLFGKYGYSKNEEQGYKTVVNAAQQDYGKASYLQGYCLEHGMGVQQNLTDANACYEKGMKLGDAMAADAKQRTDNIAKAWNLAYSGDKEAQYKLALCYADGDGITEDKSVARTWLAKSADAGYIQAQLKLCDWLIKGIGGAKDPELGVKYCEKAAIQGDPESIASLGYYYFDGKIIKQNYPKAIESFNRASEKGSESAPYMLGYCYREGLGVESDMVKACEYFRLSDKRGSLPGAFATGECFEHGKGIERNFTEALNAYKRAANAEWDAPLLGKKTSDAKEAVKRLSEIGTYWNAANLDGDGAAMDKVGQCFAKGAGVEKDDKQAYGWYCKSAEKECVDGIVHMADALYDGIGVAENKKSAGEAYERAYKQGNVHANFRLGVCYEHGWGHSKNLTIAHKLYIEAAAKGYESADSAAKKIEEPAKYWDDAFNKKDASAQYNLALCFRRGNCGVEQNSKVAFKLFSAAAASEYAAALYEKAYCLAKGEGTEKDDKELLRCALLAAEKSYASALFFVGEMYQAGYLVEQNPTTAYSYFEKAAKAGIGQAKLRMDAINQVAKYWDDAQKGIAEAQYQLGVCYRDGIQIKSDAEIAGTWFKKAAEQGNHNAEYELAMIKSRTAKDGDNSNDKEIIALLEKAATGNHLKAKVMLAKCFYDGRGVEEDYEKAIEIWKEAVNAGDLDAKYHLGEYYYTGRGLFNSGKDQDKAIKLWEEASEAGNVAASLRLGKIYAEGTGVFGSGKKRHKAQKYLLRAIERGNQEAMEVLGKLLSDSSKADKKAEGEKWLKKAKEENVDPNLRWYSELQTLQ